METKYSVGQLDAAEQSLLLFSEQLKLLWNNRSLRLQDNEIKRIETYVEKINSHITDIKIYIDKFNKVKEN